MECKLVSSKVVDVGNIPSRFYSIYPCTELLVICESKFLFMAGTTGHFIGDGQPLVVKQHPAKRSLFPCHSLVYVLGILIYPKYIGHNKISERYVVIERFGR